MSFFLKRKLLKQTVQKPFILLWNLPCVVVLIWLSAFAEWLLSASYNSKHLHRPLIFPPLVLFYSHWNEWQYFSNSLLGKISNSLIIFKNESLSLSPSLLPLCESVPFLPSLMPFPMVTSMAWGVGVGIKKCGDSAKKETNQWWPDTGHTGRKSWPLKLGFQVALDL